MKKIFYKYFIPFILVAILPVLVTGLCIYFIINTNIGEIKQKVIKESTDALKTEISYKNEAIAKTVGLEIEERISNIDQMTHVMSLSIPFRNMDIGKVKLYCGTMLYQTPAILEISVVNKIGKEIYRISRIVSVSEEDYEDISNEASFNSVQQGQCYVSDVKISDMTYLPYVLLAHPVEEYKGKFEGAILTKVDLGFIWDIVAGEKVGEKGFLYIVSDKGMLITHPSKKEIYENPEYYKYDYIKNILGAKEGTIVKEDNLVSFSINKYSWNTIIEMPLEEALRSVEAEKNTISEYARATYQTIGISGLVIIVLVIIILVPIGIGVTKSIVNPVLKLTAVTEKVSKGDLSSRADIITNDEIGVLTSSFNKMTEDLGKSRDELILARDYTENIVKSMIDTLIVVAPDGNIKTINPATVDLLGYKEDELIGHPVATIFAEEEEEEEEEEEVTPFKGTRMQKLIEEGSLKDYDMTYKTKSGEKIPVSFSGSVMRDKEGELVGIVGIARDMREIKHLHEKLIKSEKLATLGQLSSNVAHEIRNPLGIIRTSAYYLKSELPEEDLKIKSHLEILERESLRASKIISDILEFSRAVELEYQPTNVNTQIEEVLNSLKEQKLQPENVTLDVHLEEDLPDIPADPEALSRVFINIVTNALEAMPEGGQLKISTELSKEDKTVKVIISDTGVGISKEMLSRLYEPFTTTKKKGMGLGLAIVRGIIDRHKGSIDVISEVNKGTTVTITLPTEGK